MPIGQWHAIDRGFRANKKVSSGHHSGFLSGDPDWLTAIPAAVLHGLAVAHCVEPGSVLARKLIAYQVVISWKQTSCNRIVIGKGQRRKDRDHALCPNTVGRDAIERRRVITILIIPAKTVNGNENQIRLVALIGGIDPTGTGRKRCAAKEQDK